MEGYRREDPPAVPQLAVPITVANKAYTMGQQQSNPMKQAAGELALIAFYFLLRVGEYTKPKYVLQHGTRKRTTRTVQFSVGNVGFFKDGKIIPRSSSLETLLQCDAVTLKISNQKNGRMGDTIHQRAVPHIKENPVAAVATRVHHILSHGGNDSSLLCEYWDGQAFTSIESKDIIEIVREAATELNTSEQAIDPDLIGAHSLRAGGAMALKLHGYDDTTIMKMGRWTSLTFLQYIHSQIAHLSADISAKMSMPLPFLNIAAIEASA